MLVPLQGIGTELCIFEPPTIPVLRSVGGADNALANVPLFIGSFVERPREVWIGQRLLDRLDFVDRYLSGDGLCDAHGQCITEPPSTTNVWPVMKSLSSDAKKATAPAMSSGT